MHGEQKNEIRSGSAMRAGAWIAAILAVVLMAEAVGFTWHAYRLAQRKLTPENLVDTAENAIRENYQEMREMLTTEIKERAPEIAEQLSREMIASSPEVREWLEQMTARQLEYGLEEVTHLSAEQFRLFLQENRPTVMLAFDRIEDAPEEAHQLVLKLESKLEARIGVDVQKQAQRALELHRQLNVKLERLTDPGETLSPKEILERRMVRILRTLQEEKFAAAQPLNASTAETQLTGK